MSIFIRFGLLRFSGALREDAHKFLVNCQERLHNLGLVESHRVNWLTKDRQRDFVECRPAGSLPMTWPQFSEAFLGRYMPRSIQK